MVPIFLRRETLEGVGLLLRVLLLLDWIGVIQTGCHRKFIGGIEKCTFACSTSWMRLSSFTSRIVARLKVMPAMRRVCARVIQNSC